jgi:hypothetical protein
VDLSELACDLSIADCIEEVAEDRLSVRMHVGAPAVPLQRFKFIDRVLLGRGVVNFLFRRNSHLKLPSFGLDTKLCPRCRLWHRTDVTLDGLSVVN